jgi:ribosomal protein S12 methylthiotransferase accessory factor
LEQDRKLHFAGTHRACTPSETLRRITPFFGRFGITRIADITWLDEIGIPVFQAVRPNGYTLSVAQGKGLSPELARASAAMEAIETWHAERVGPGACVETVGNIEPTLDYSIGELNLVPRHHLNPALRLEWSSARELVGGGETLVPTKLLRMDGRASERWEPQLFHVTSNGLASGNTLDEAVLHALYEVIERDSAHRAAGAGRRLLDIATVEGPAGRLLELLSAAHVEVRVEVITGPLGLPCFRAAITSDLFPVVFLGLGCHLDRDVALCRALTEAAQSRLTSISGVRDDMTAEGYWQANEVTAGQNDGPDLGLGFEDATEISYQDVDSVHNQDLRDDLRLVGARVREYTGRDPLVIDHTRPDIGIPVVRVVCPRLRHDVGRSL